MRSILLITVMITGLIFSGCANESSAPAVAKVENKQAAKPMKNFRAVPANKAEILQEGKGKNFCPVCGMTLPMFYKTNHAAKHNGHNKQYCSIHCMAEDKEVNGKELTGFKAVDNTTLKFKDSKDMFFVVGSKKPGTMSAVSKYGFGTKEAASKFASKFGGKIMNFDEVYAFSKDRLKADIAATKKRQGKAAMKGKKIYNKVCNKTDMRFTKPAEAKTYIVENKLCGNIKGKKLQMVALYLSGKAKGMKAGKCSKGKCGAGKCGGSKPNKAMKCASGKCGQGKCGK